jgi:hypothetical protein
MLYVPDELHPSKPRPPLPRELRILLGKVGTGCSRQLFPNTNRCSPMINSLWASRNSENRRLSSRQGNRERSQASIGPRECNRNLILSTNKMRRVCTGGAFLLVAMLSLSLARQVVRMAVGPRRGRKRLRNSFRLSLLTAAFLLLSCLARLVLRRRIPRVR